MRLHRAAGAGLLIALCLSGCVPSAVTRTPAEIAAEQDAAALARQGRFDEAALAYQNLARQSRAADHYLLLAAESYRQSGSLDRATPLLAEVRRARLQDDEPVRYDLLEAELALSRHDDARALQLTTQPSIAVPPALQLRLMELRARAQEASGDDWGAAHTRVEMDARLSGLDQTQNRKQIVDLLAKLDAEPLQRRAAAMPPNEPMLTWINEALSRLGVAVAHPQPTLEQPVGTLLPGTGANVREGYTMPAKVALLLPLGGSFAPASAAIREGFFAAYADAARNHAPRAAVKVYDSGGDAAGALKAYQQAVDDGAKLVIGPLTRSEVAAVFGQAQLPVPLLALNHPDDRALPASGVNEFGLLPEAEGAQVADHMIERGLRSAYVVVTTDDFAQRAAGAFKAELAARGGQVAGMASLPAGSVNYAGAIEGLHAADATEAGVFISMRPQQARLLVPQLRLARVALPVFGTSHVYAGQDDAGADRDLEGVEFCDAPWLFDAQPGLPDHAHLADQLPAARGAAARLFGFGMDAWNLVPYLDWLRGHPGSYLPGASGQLAADQFGRIRRVLVWAKFADGLARPLGGSLQIDNVPAETPPVDAPPPAPQNAQPAAAPGHGTP
ncbi:penicillin-binding protein activator [Frateuria defendens]|uniref:penicillin-binding protein activator n=1 Tax=Frateuria defendens TaxID=2219559 RepID=UPI00066FC3B6|nr:penicillin-binding protein activator [Frateuria defendens]